MTSSYPGTLLLIELMVNLTLERDQGRKRKERNQKDKGREEKEKEKPEKERGDKEDTDCNLLTCQVSWDKILFPVNVCDPCTRHLLHNHLGQRGTEMENKLLC